MLKIRKSGPDLELGLLGAAEVGFTVGDVGTCAGSSRPTPLEHIEQRGVSAAFLTHLTATQLTNTMEREASVRAITFLKRQITSVKREIAQARADVARAAQPERTLSPPADDAELPEPEPEPEPELPELEPELPEPEPEPEPESAVVDMLVLYGFERDVVLTALEAAGGNIQMATEMLVEQVGVDSDKVRAAQACIAARESGAMARAAEASLAAAQTEHAPGTGQESGAGAETGLELKPDGAHFLSLLDEPDLLAPTVTVADANTGSGPEARVRWRVVGAHQQDATRRAEITTTRFRMKFKHSSWLTWRWQYIDVILNETPDCMRIAGSQDGSCEFILKNRPGQLEKLGKYYIAIAPLYKWHNTWIVMKWSKATPFVLQAGIPEAEPEYDETTRTQELKVLKRRLAQYNKDLRKRESEPYLTSRDVHELLVVAQTKERMCRYLELPDVRHGKDEAGRGWVGVAQYFFSYSWDSPWESVVSALMSHTEKQVSAGKPPPYYWIDIFAVNQHLSMPPWQCLSGLSDCPGCAAVAADMHDWATADPNHLRGFERVIAHTRHTLVLNEPWDNPRPPTRVWCLFEGYQTLSRGGELEVVLGKEQQQELQLTLEKRFTDLQAIVEGIDARLADATVAVDRDNIFGAIDQLPGGFSGLNDKMQFAQQRWLCSTAKLVIARTDPQRPRLDETAMALEVADIGDGWRKGAKLTWLLEWLPRLPSLLGLLEQPLHVVGTLAVLVAGGVIAWACVLGVGKILGGNYDFEINHFHIPFFLGMLVVGVILRRVPGTLVVAFTRHQRVRQLRQPPLLGDWVTRHGSEKSSSWLGFRVGAIIALSSLLVYREDLTDFYTNAHGHADQILSVFVYIAVYGLAPWAGAWLLTMLFMPAVLAQTIANAQFAAANRASLRTKVGVLQLQVGDAQGALSQLDEALSELERAVGSEDKLPTLPEGYCFCIEEGSVCSRLCCSSRSRGAFMEGSDSYDACEVAFKELRKALRQSKRTVLEDPMTPPSTQTFMVTDNAGYHSGHRNAVQLQVSTSGVAMVLKPAQNKKNCCCCERASIRADSLYKTREDSRYAWPQIKKWENRKTSFVMTDAKGREHKFHTSESVAIDEAFHVHIEHVRAVKEELAREQENIDPKARARAQADLDGGRCGLTISGHISDAYNGTYRAVNERDGWPVLRNEHGIWLFRRGESWRMCKNHTWDKDECNSYYRSTDGSFPIGEHSWHKYDSVTRRFLPHTMTMSQCLR